MVMRYPKGTSLYPVAKEVQLSTDLAKLLAEMADVDSTSEAHIMRVALERLALAYRRRGPQALRLQSLQRRRNRKDDRSTPPPSEIEAKATSAG